MDFHEILRIGRTSTRNHMEHFDHHLDTGILPVVCWGNECLLAINLIFSILRGGGHLLI